MTNALFYGDNLAVLRGKPAITSASDNLSR
jgi:hypothetical protein